MTSAVVKNQETKQSEQRSHGDCWQLKANGQCSKGDNCSFRHDINKRAKSTHPNPSPRSSTQQNVKNAKSPRSRSPSGKWLDCRCKDYFKGKLAPLHSVKMASSGCLFYKSEKGCKLEDKCSCAHRHVDEQPSKRSKKEL